MDTISININKNIEMPIMDRLARMMKEYSLSTRGSINLIHIQTRIPKQYVYDLSNGMILEKNADPVRVFQVVKFITKDESRAFRFIKDKDVWHETVKIWLGRDESKTSYFVESQETDERLLESVGDEELIAYVASANFTGVDDGQLMSFNGKKLVAAAKKLLGLGIIEKDENGKYKNSSLRKVERGSYFWSRSATLRIAKAFLGFYNPEHSGKKRNYLYIGHEGLSKECIESVQSKIAETRKFIDEEVAKDENKGGNHAFWTFVLDTFNDEMIEDVESEGVFQ